MVVHYRHTVHTQIHTCIQLCTLTSEFAVLAHDRVVVRVCITQELKTWRNKQLVTAEGQRTRL